MYFAENLGYHDNGFGGFCQISAECSSLQSEQWNSPLNHLAPMYCKGRWMDSDGSGVVPD